MIIAKRWEEVEAGTRVKDPAGQIFHVIARYGAFVSVRALDGTTHTLVIRTQDYIPTVLEPEDFAVACLRKHFPTLEFLKEER